ncbi:MAG: hypothetical protein AB7T01_04695 [Acidithiobacillus sp.]
MVKRFISVKVASALVGILLVLLSTSSFAGRVSDLSLGPVGGVGPVPMIGIILPSSPDTYSQYTSKMLHLKAYRVGMFTYTTGTIDHVPVVLSSPPPIGSFSLTAIDTYLMENIFRPKMVIDPGTAGSHLPLLSMGDIVIGARVVNFSNYMTEADGRIVPGQFSALVTDNEGYKDGNPNPEYLYSDPFLVHLAYSAAIAVARYTPAEILHGKTGRRPWVMEYGTQGSGAAWLRNVKQIKASTKIFHEADEAGNYPIALISSINKIPFVEIHTISDAAMNVPTKMDDYFHQCSVYAQERSNNFVLAMIRQLAVRLNVGTPRTGGGFFDPYPAGIFEKAMLAPDYVRSWTRENSVQR